ncbi:MAG TPA: hypothetical protein VM262_07455 [Acidimicrobiales bacterium]|nr:hypothetical protein [Acidimicrobiales bacterium]
MVGGEAALTLVHHRPVVDVDGGVRALVDTGGKALMLSQTLADHLGLAVIETVEEQGEVFTVLEPPRLSVGGYELDTDGLPSYGFEDTRVLGLAASGLDLSLPAALVTRHAVVLDPVGGVAWFGEPGTLEADGVRVAATVVRDTGLVGLDVTVLGEAARLLLDTGVSCSLAADTSVRSWLASVPDLPTSAAGVGPGNLAGLRVEARTPMVRVPLVEWGEFTVPGVAFTWRADPDVAPYDGSLGGNVLRSFKLGLDLSRGDVRVEQRAPVPADGGGDADQVGVTLVLDDEGEWEVGAAVTGLPPAVQAGDRLVSVDGGPVTGVALGEVLAALGGSIGATHHLVLRRGDTLVEADAPVLRLL